LKYWKVGWNGGPADGKPFFLPRVRGCYDLTQLVSAKLADSTQQISCLPTQSGPLQPGIQLVFAEEQGQGFNILHLRASTSEDASAWERIMRGLLGRGLLQGALHPGDVAIDVRKANEAADQSRMLAWYQSQKKAASGGLSINISLADGSSFAVEVGKDTCMICDVKKGVEEQTGWTVKQQVIMREGAHGNHAGDTVLGNDMTLRQCGVGDGATLMVLLNSVMCKVSTAPTPTHICTPPHPLPVLSCLLLICV
jgi:hypothetical protein